jgi:uncharacterized protein
MFTTKHLFRTNTLDESLDSFILMTIVLATLLSFSSITFFIVHLNISKHMLGYLSYLFFILTIVLLFFMMILHVSTIYVYRTKHTNSILLFVLKIETNFLLPALIAYSGFFKNYKNNINVFFINLNNIIVKSMNKKFTNDEILILLPHCLQNSNCSFKITNDISNCQKCHSCNIGSVREIAEEYKIINIEVVSGGTAARNVIPKIKPGLVIAIACERELITGIADIKKIPVIGILNLRPNGPCVNTGVDIDKLREVLEGVIYDNPVELPGS